MRLIVLIFRFVHRFLRTVAAVVRMNAHVSGSFSASWLSQVIRLVVLVALLHQFGLTSVRILTIRSGIESLLASLAGCVLLWVIQNPSRMVPPWFILRWRLALVVLFAVVVLVKLCWVLCVSSFQSTDYGRYLSIGELLCDGRWDLIAARAEPLLRTYVRRATVVTLPAIWCFGRGIAAIEAWNFLLQSGTLVLFWLLVKLLTNSRAAGAVAVVLLWLMPEFWYTATIASHNVSANFLLCSSLLLLLLFRRSLQHLDSRPLATVVTALCLAAATGLTIALLELCRDTGKLLIGAICVEGLVAIVPLLRVPWSFARWRTVLCVAGLLIGMISYLLVTHSIDSVIASRIPAQTVTLASSFSALDTTGHGLGREVEPWRRQYFPAIPSADQSGVAFRRILHEKMASGEQFWLFMFRKNEVFSWQSDALTQVFDRLQGIERPLKHTRVPWNSLQQGLCDHFYLLILLLVISRVLLSGLFPVWNGESTALWYAGLYGLLIFLLTEAHPYYSQGFLLMLCLSGATVLDFWRRHGSKSAAQSGITPGAGLWQMIGWQRGLLKAGLVMSVVVLLHIAVGRLLDSSGLLYGHFSPLPAATAAAAAETKISRVHAAVAWPFGESATEQTAIAGFRLRGPSWPADSLCFFLTANQRKDEKLRLQPNESPIQYEVLIDGRMWQRGLLTDLNQPQFCRIRLADWAKPGSQDLHIEVRLSGKRKSGVVLPECLAIEYPAFELK
jgi:hypothetical protein